MAQGGEQCSTGVLRGQSKYHDNEDGQLSMRGGETMVIPRTRTAPEGPHPYLDRFASGMHTPIEDDAAWRRTAIQPMPIPDLSHIGIRTAFSHGLEVFTGDGSMTEIFRTSIRDTVRDLPRRSFGDSRDMKARDYARIVRKHKAGKGDESLLQTVELGLGLSDGVGRCSALRRKGHTQNVLMQSGSVDTLRRAHVGRSPTWSGNGGGKGREEVLQRELNSMGLLTSGGIRTNYATAPDPVDPRLTPTIDLTHNSGTSGTWRTNFSRVGRPEGQDQNVTTPSKPEQEVREEACGTVIDNPALEDNEHPQSTSLGGGRDKTMISSSSPRGTKPGIAAAGTARNRGRGSSRGGSPGPGGGLGRYKGCLKRDSAGMEPGEWAGGRATKTIDNDNNKSNNSKPAWPWAESRSPAPTGKERGGGGGGSGGLGRTRGTRRRLGSPTGRLKKPFSTDSLFDCLLDMRYGKMTDLGGGGSRGGHSGHSGHGGGTSGVEGWDLTGLPVGLVRMAGQCPCRGGRDDGAGACGEDGCCECG
ncbi:unnamed protein product, partial [Discosporangium mesarthrocarpum]